MGADKINKIIYFDKETIRNILQEKDKGDLFNMINMSSLTQNQGSIEVEASAKLKLDVPFISRVSFMLTGKIDASYIVKREKATTITSTEISEFENLKTSLKCLEDIQLSDIENSSTFFRVAGGYMRMLKGGIDDVDVKEFKAVMDGFEGYDTYKIDEEKYVRFNNTAFVSNYKRNDLLTTTMTLYCISVGEFSKDRFDFMKEIGKMENLISTADQPQTLAEAYPSGAIPTLEKKQVNTTQNQENKVVLYDVLYACVTAEESDGQ